MIRALMLTAALAAPLSVAALAETSSRGALFSENQARVHLMHLGYADVSNLTKDENGVWHGTATKDGETRNVAVDLKGAVTK